MEADTDAHAKDFILLKHFDMGVALQQFRKDP